MSRGSEGSTAQAVEIFRAGLETLLAEDARAKTSEKFRERLFTLQQGPIGTPAPYPLLDECGRSVLDAEGRPVVRDDRLKRNVFSDLCEAASVAFRDPFLSDTDIRNHPATPELVRYVLGAFRQFAANGSTTDKAIASAFCPRRRGSSPKLEPLRTLMVETAMAAKTEALRAHPDDKPAAYHAGLEAAYAIYRNGEKPGHDGKDMRKAKNDIWAILAWELPWPADRPALKSRGAKRVK